MTENHLITLSPEARVLWQIRQRLNTIVDEVETIKSRQVILSNKLDTIKSRQVMIGNKLDTIIQNTTP